VSRSVAVALVVLALVLVAVAPVSAKGGIVAKVRVPVSREAAPGTKVTMVWELTAVESGRAQPFDADGIFLRLFGPRGPRTPRPTRSGSSGPATAPPRGCPVEA
jgi:hypothetical protein